MHETNGALPSVALHQENHDFAYQQILTGKQEHYLKRELIARQVQTEIAELNSPTALRRFGAPFKSEFGEVAPIDSELPILRYIFVHHVRNFPFLDQAREKEFWQDKLQVFLESFANKNVSSSEDRLEETKRRKLARKCEKLVELMMVSGIPTASGYEERIQFSEMEVVDRSANEKGLLVNMPEGNAINGWDINVAAVRVTSVRRTVRHHQHAEFIIRVRRNAQKDIFVARRFGDFARLLKRLRTEIPGKPLPPLPRKNKSSSTSTIWGGTVEDDESSISSTSTTPDGNVLEERSSRNLIPGDFPGRTRSRSRSSVRKSPRASADIPREAVLFREEQRISLRAFLRTLLQNKRVAESKALEEFFTLDPFVPGQEETLDMERRKEVDSVRIEEQKRFYEIARQRAAELDVYMEKFRRDIVESNGLTKLFAEIREKQTVEDLSPQYQKFAEWLRIEVAATLYHLFLAEDNSPELFAQAKRIHSLVPYTLLKNVIRIANPAAVMTGVLDLFLAQPFGSKSLMQRIFSMTLNDGIKGFQRSIDAMAAKVDDPVISQKLKAFTDADEMVKNEIRQEAIEDDVDVVVAILRSEYIPGELTVDQIGKVFNSFVAWNYAVEHVDEEMREGADWFGNVKQLLKLYTRQRDKAMMLSIIEEPVTVQLFRDLFTIFYEPLVRVYKSANVYNSITDFAKFADDTIAVIEKCQKQDISADPNQTVQAFIELCERHQASLYKFVHEVHLHDNGLFGSLMSWIENILDFLRNGPSGGKLDMNALFRGAKDVGQIDHNLAREEIDKLIKWHEDRKTWHLNKTRQKMAAEGTVSSPFNTKFKGSDFGLDEADLEHLAISDADSDPSDDLDAEDEAEELDPIAVERKRRSRKQDQLRRTAGEPVKPEVTEILKLSEPFGVLLRQVLAD
ncbi:Putative PX domain protein [Aspergillus calidoustus]|uniref:Putative PX domain protein n=1 Tax=Aspergillus calidoustus TaxID=454130 RepID=A0A0U5H0J4_ASPCI|nr:Putative PX domain protein [Aspergillus calidoustus]